MKLKISEPTMIAMGPDSRKAGWGPYQFPDLLVLDDGKLICCGTHEELIKYCGEYR